ncbi:MAG: hypothetical protein GX647_06230 [Clostridiales bacterium]|jgi:hypothetical protein|nr:hypothetical protein [Clostridiales bacterium]OPZ67255.1 MAG: hypothetical protein BWY81_01405 [Firmicutes bacterium ADurb.Bin467]
MDVRVEIAGRALILRYTVNSMCVVEEMAGGSLLDALNSDFTAARLLFWGALMDKQAGITLREAGELIDEHLRGGGSLSGIVDLCAEALGRAGFLSEHA